jgi:hypothetical protein
LKVALKAILNIYIDESDDACKVEELAKLHNIFFRLAQNRQELISKNLNAKKCDRIKQ